MTLSASPHESREWRSDGLIIRKNPMFMRVFSALEHAIEIALTAFDCLYHMQGTIAATQMKHSRRAESDRCFVSCCPSCTSIGMG